MRYQVYIENNGAFVATTASLVLPFNTQSLLDEMLDQAVFVCYNSSKEIVPVYTSAKVSIFERNAQGQDVSVKDLYMTVANDDAIEYPVGSGKYKHTVSLVEATKDLEGIYCQTMTFRNSLPKATEKQNARLYAIHYGGEAKPAYNGTISITTLQTPQFGNTYTLPSPNTIANAFKTAWQAKGYEYLGNLTSASYTYDTLEATGTKSGNETVTVGNSTGVVKITQAMNFSGTNCGFTCSISLLPLQASRETKKWTISACIKRAFDLAEPIYTTTAGQVQINAPRFELDATDDAELDKILASEFTFEKSNLRECLKTIGGKIHAEPRAKEVYFSSGIKKYKIGFDYFSKQEKTIFANPFMIRQNKMDISNFCTRLYADAKNIVSSLNFGATRTEPANGGFIGVRAEQTDYRVDASNSIVKTAEPIYDLISVKVKIIEDDGTQVHAETDITDLCYEATIYDNLLSSKNVYPDSKAYALRWERGSKNITGLFYQAPNAVSQAFSRYALSNVIAQKSNNPQYYANAIDRILTDNTHIACFQVVYKPVTDTSFIHEKNEYSKGYSYTTPYNQSASLVELDYYGEHIRGAVERLGNPEKIYTAIYETYSAIPNIGTIVELTDGEYYITAETISVESDHYKVSLALSKNFNRLSEYVGIDSQKRISEIDKNQSHDRDVILPVKLVVGALPATPSTPFIKVPIVNFRNLFKNETVSPITQAMVVSGSVKVCLPAMATGYGLTTVMTVSMKDNYSAGEQLRWVSSGDDDISGYWQKDVRFGDYFGRAPYLDVYFKDAIDITNSFAITSPVTSKNIPQNSVCFNDCSYLLRKDSGERLSTIGFSICAQTSIDGLTLGSGISKMNGLVTNTTPEVGETAVKAKIYFVPTNKELPYKMDDNIIDYDYDDWESADIDCSSVTNNTFYLQSVDAPIAGKGFVIAFPVSEETLVTDDEYGNRVEQTIKKGGEIIMVSNKPFTALQSLLGTEYTFRME